MRITKLRYGRQICAPVDYLDRACAVKFHDPCKFIDACGCGSRRLDCGAEV